MLKQDVYPYIHYLKASAGAGKTYQLTIRFLSLLAGMKPSAEVLRQIVAITFTNRAASEMKERIILALKQIALGEVEGARLTHEGGLRPSEATAWLGTILAHFRVFQLFRHLLERYRRVEEAGGLVVERGIRRRIRELYEKADIHSTAGPQPELSRAEDKLRYVAQKLLAAIHKGGWAEK